MKGRLQPESPNEPTPSSPDATSALSPQRLASGTRTKRPPTNVELPPTRLVGRQVEMDALRSLLRRDRLVTVLGAPGMGKTRLAKECALRSLEDFSRDGGVWFVDLTEVVGLDGLCGAVGRALGIDVSTGGEAGVAHLAAAIAARGPMLLLLDNAEQLVEPLAVALDKWMRVARDARWLVTSRVRLAIPGEALFELGPLSLPVAGVDVQLSDAVRLFVERARASRFDFALTNDDTPTVAALVRELDGNALAIELAAARIRVLTPAQMLTHLAKRFELLAGAPRRGHARHVTLRAAIDSSWNLLEEHEKRALAQCSVFSGGFDVDAAEKVLDVGTHSIVDTLEALRDKSLVYSSAAAERRGELRFSTYLSVREYAFERLGESGEKDAAVARHARFYLARGSRDVTRLEGPDGVVARARIAADMENLLTVHRRALDAIAEKGASSALAAHALEAALVLDPLLASTGPNTLRFQILDKALAASTGAVVTSPSGARDSAVDPAMLARGYEARGDAHRMLGRAAEAIQDYTDALGIADDCGAEDVHGRVLDGLGILSIWQGHLDEAREYFEKAMTLHRKVGDRVYEGRALGWLGNVHLQENDLEKAWSVLERAITIHRVVGDRRFEGMNVGNLAVIAHDGGRLDEAKTLYERALNVHREIGDRRLEAEVMGLLGIVAHEEGRLDDARDLYTRALEIHSAVGNRRAEGTLLGYLAGFLLEVGESEEARLSYSRALCILRECQDHPTEGLVLGGLATLEATEGCMESARAALHRATECLRASSSATGIEERYLAAVEIDRGHLELALAREAARAGDESRSTMYLNAVKQRLAEAIGTADAFTTARTGLAHRSADVRMAARALRRALESSERGGGGVAEATRLRAGEVSGDRASGPGPQLDMPPDALLVCARGRWFRAPHGEHIAISRWQALQNLVVKLAERRELAPGEPLSVDELIAAGWPGERIMAKAGATRVYTALSTLRRLGLREVLARRDGGYMLSPAVPLVRVSARG